MSALITARLVLDVVRPLARKYKVPINTVHPTVVATLAHQIESGLSNYKVARQVVDVVLRMLTKVAKQ